MKALKLLLTSRKGQLVIAAMLVTLAQPLGVMDPNVALALLGVIAVAIGAVAHEDAAAKQGTAWARPSAEATVTIVPNTPVEPPTSKVDELLEPEPLPPPPKPGDEP